MESNIESLALASAFLSGMALALGIVLLAMIVRLNRRVQSLEGWLAREFARMSAALDSMGARAAELSGRGATQTAQAAEVQPYYPAIQQGTPPASTQLSPFAPPRRPSPAAAMQTERGLSSRGDELTQAVNKLLLSNQPFNFSETLQESNPRLTLLRMSVRGAPDLWSASVTLAPGGDGYFACIEQNRAYLFPNYDRFSTAHDPKLLFDGARLDSRINAVMKPAALARLSDGTWQLSEKGQVQMR